MGNLWRANKNVMIETETGVEFSVRKVSLAENLWRFFVGWLLPSQKLAWDLRRSPLVRLRTFLLWGGGCRNARLRRATARIERFLYRNL